jgi:hypothetical protein
MNEILSFKEFSRRFPTFSESSLRWIAFNADSNGFCTAFRKIGRRRYIVPEIFFRLVDELNGINSEEGVSC